MNLSLFLDNGMTYNIIKNSGQMNQLGIDDAILQDYYNIEFKKDF